MSEYFLNEEPLDAFWGLCLGRIEFRSWGADTATLTAVDGWTEDNDLVDPARFYDGMAVTLADSERILLVGKLYAVQRQAGGTSRRRSYVIKGPVAVLESLVYQQIWRFYQDGEQVDFWRSKCLLFSGSATSAQAQAAEILAFAAEQAGGFTVGDVTLPTQTLLPSEVQDQTCLAVLRQVCRFAPNVDLWAEYSTGTAVMHLKPASGRVTMPVVDNSSGWWATDVAANRLADLRPPCVVVKSERLNSIAGRQVVECWEEVARASGDTTSSSLTPGAVVQTIATQGMSSSCTTSHTDVVTRTVPADGAGGDDGTTDQVALRKWWGFHLPWLNHPDIAPFVESGKIVLCAHKVTVGPGPGTTDSGGVPSFEHFGDGGTNDSDYSTDPEDYPRELVDGTIPATRTQTRVAPCVAHVTVKWAGEPADATEVIFKLFTSSLSKAWEQSASYTGTDMTTQRITQIDSAEFQTAEPWPTGIAAAAFAAMDYPHFQGSATLVGETMSVVRPGKLLAFSGGRSEWNAMDAPVQSVALDLLSRRSTITFGPAGVLTVNDLYEYLRMSRSSPAAPGGSGAAASRETAAPASGGSVSQGRRGPKSNAMARPDAGVPDFCWLPYIKTGNVAFTGGTVGGVVPTVGGSALESGTLSYPGSAVYSYFSIKWSPRAVLRSNGEYAPQGGDIISVEILLGVVGSFTAGLIMRASVDSETGFVVDNGEYNHPFARFEVVSGKIANLSRYAYFSLAVTFCDTAVIGI
jgi:hypothetical protein